MVERNRVPFAARIALAGVVLGNVGCTAASSSAAEEARCPITAVEVSYLAGGSPQSWSPDPERRGAWYFESETEQILNAARIGRVDADGRGQIVPTIAVRTKRAWYVCPSSRDLTNQATPPPAKVNNAS